MRVNHDCNSNHQNILMSIYGSTGLLIEAKCLDINQIKTEQIAVGANDPYVRLYDRRMIRTLSAFKMHLSQENNPSDSLLNFDSTKVSSTINTEPEQIVQYFVPGHIHSEETINVFSNKNKNIGITYLTFSPNGQELLVNYGGEYVYLYDIMNQIDCAFCNIPKTIQIPRKFCQQQYSIFT